MSSGEAVNFERLRVASQARFLANQALWSPRSGTARASEPPAHRAPASGRSDAVAMQDVSKPQELAGGAIYLDAVVGWAFWHAGADTIGGFFEGFFATLAFLWLVVGLFIQQKELSRTRE